MTKKKHSRKKTDRTRKKQAINKSGQESISTLISSALLLCERGDMSKAKKVFLKVLTKQPDNADANFNLGIISENQKNRSDALNYYQKAISTDKNYVNAYFNIGGIYINLQKYDLAVEQFEKVVSISPDYAAAWYNLGFISGEQKKHDKALDYYEKAVSVDPNYYDAMFNIASIKHNQKKIEDAIKLYKKVIFLKTDHTEAMFNLASILQNMEKYSEAADYYKKIILINPEYHLAYNNLGLIYQTRNKFDDAISHFKKAVSIASDYSGAHMNMGNIYRHKGDIDNTVKCYEKSIAIEPSIVGLTNLCGYQKEQFNYEQVYELTQQILKYDNLPVPDLSNIHDTYIQLCEWDKAAAIIEKIKKADIESKTRDVFAGCFMELCSITELSIDEISEFHKKWGALTEKATNLFEHNNDKEKLKLNKKIRIGYSSPDLREHSVGYLIKDIITSHNQNDFEIYCYANFDSKNADAFTQEIINSCKLFKYVKHLTDKELAQEIFDDKIDILIDLAGHTAGHRLRSFAFRPALIQITYLGYPNTTGLSRIDYRITDRYAEAAVEYDYRYSEKLIRLTNCFLSFNGFHGIVPVKVADKKNKKIIFGCFNNIQKLKPKVIELWSEILKNVEDSILHLKAKQLNTEIVWNNVVKEFAKHNISQDKIKCIGYTNTRQEHLQLYNEIDIALDTFPYNGTVTTLEALWMNIPVVTLVGQSHAQRVGYSILKNIDLDSLIALTEEEYVSKSIKLARNPEMITELKTKMRKNLIASPICNPAIVTREIELNIKKIWAEYLHGQNKSKSDFTKIEKCEQKSCNSDESNILETAITDASRLRLAMIKLKAGEYEKALEISSSLVTKKGISSLALYVHGVSLFRLDQPEKAISALNKSLDFDNKNSGAWKILGELYLSEGKIDKANNCLEKIWEIQSNYSHTKHV